MDGYKLFVGKLCINLQYTGCVGGQKARLWTAQWTPRAKIVMHTFLRAGGRFLRTLIQEVRVSRWDAGMPYIFFQAPPNPLDCAMSQGDLLTQPDSYATFTPLTPASVTHLWATAFNKSLCNSPICAFWSSAFNTVMFPHGYTHFYVEFQALHTMSLNEHWKLNHIELWPIREKNFQKEKRTTMLSQMFRIFFICSSGSSWGHFSSWCCLTHVSWSILTLIRCFLLKWWDVNTNIYACWQNAKLSHTDIVNWTTAHVTQLTHTHNSLI